MDMRGAVGIGAHWIEFEHQCYHCAAAFVFQNIASGAVKRDPTSSSVYPDLDSPTLAHRICRGLQVPSDGSVTFEGSFALLFKLVYLGDGRSVIRQLRARALPIQAPGESRDDVCDRDRRRADRR